MCWDKKILEMQLRQKNTGSTTTSRSGKSQAKSLRNGAEVKASTGVRGRKRKKPVDEAEDVVSFYVRIIIVD